MEEELKFIKDNASSKNLYEDIETNTRTLTRFLEVNYGK
jgi:hypothetical protein